jgi:Leucine-rich repeat (LRR) protein
METIGLLANPTNLPIPRENKINADAPPKPLHRPINQTTPRHSAVRRNKAIATAAFSTLFIAILVMAAIGVGFLTPGSASAQTVTNICGRTAAVEQAILNTSTGSPTCSTITEDQLAGINSLSITGYGRVTIVPSDFRGLTRVSSLEITDSPHLTSVPANAFSELPNLGILHLSSNSISSLHENSFDGLPRLFLIDLQRNQISSLHEDVFDGLSSVTILKLSYNSITSLDAGIFDGLPSLSDIQLKCWGKSMG